MDEKIRKQRMKELDNMSYLEMFRLFRCEYVHKYFDDKQVLNHFNKVLNEKGNAITVKEKQEIEKRVYSGNPLTTVSDSDYQSGKGVKKIGYIHNWLNVESSRNATMNTCVMCGSDKSSYDKYCISCETALKKEQREYKQGLV